MKKLHFLILILLCAWTAHAQMTDVQLGQAADTIQNETVRGANTAERIGRMFNNIIDNKVNVNTQYGNPSFVNTLSWSKLISTPTTLSGYGITDAVPSSRTIAGLDLSTNRTATEIKTALQVPVTYGVACSDLSTTLSAGTNKGFIPVPVGFTVTEVYAYVLTAQTSGGILTIDINEGGVSILSTKLTIDNNETSSTTAATPYVLSDTAIAAHGRLTVDIDQGSGGTGLVVLVKGY